MEVAPVRVWLAVAVVVALASAAVVWSATNGRPGGPVSALEVESASREAAGGGHPHPSLPPSRGKEQEAAPNLFPSRVKEQEAALSPPGGKEQEAAGGAQAALSSDTLRDAPADEGKAAAREQDLRGGLRIGGHSRLMDSFIGVVDVDEADVAKTINVHILRDEDYRYYFDLDSDTVPAGERVRFVVNNTHFTPDECW